MAAASNNEPKQEGSGGTGGFASEGGQPLIPRGESGKLAEEMSARHKAIIESSDDAIITKSLEGIITSWNHGAETMFGHSARDAIGQSIHLIIPADRREEEDKIIAKVKRGERVRQFETTRMRKDGLPVQVSATIYPIINDAGQVIGISKIARDITERKSLEAQFRHTQKMDAVSRLAGGVAHDFNNLLGIISGYCELLLDDLPVGHPRHEYLVEIQRAGERAANLTRQLLAYSRKQILVTDVIDPSFVVKDCENLLRHVLGEDVILTIVPQPQLKRARVDVGEFEQALLNLVLNARDAMPRGGKLTIETANVTLDETYTLKHFEVMPGDYVMIAVSDTGAGMEKTTLTNIFEPFFTTKEKGRGSGLGLAMVFGFLKQSGGHISVYSEPGLGSTFKMYFPAVDPVAAKEASAEAGKAARHGTETILLVEDENDLRKLARQILTQQGYTVLEAADGADAMRVVAAFPGNIDLLITDVVMPNMGGPQLAEKISVLRPGARVLYMSGYTDDAVVRHGVLSAETAFIQKPFSVDGLAIKIRKVLGHSPKAS
jgi:PAS domain S-box-containing protein